ncbi:hypothetical protein FQR65_LT12057 [Abscondita terminalis]|nr:hypothetical protein FQR65_LT12057 [Abscondita terminalis]
MIKKFVIFLLLIVICKGRVHQCQVFDLSWPFNNRTVFWGDSEGFQFTNQIASEQSNGDWYVRKNFKSMFFSILNRFATNDFKSSEHGGTHLDAPYHFVKTGWKVGDIPLQNLLASGIKIDLSDISNNDALLLPKHLVAWKKKYGSIPTNSIILVYFNWSTYYHNKTQYLGGVAPSSYKFPGTIVSIYDLFEIHIVLSLGISLEAAEWIVQNTKIVGIGIDTASIDQGQSISFSAHKIFLKNNIYQLENVKIPKSLPVKGFKLIVMPMNIQEGTGAPVRLVAYSKACWRIFLES